MQQWDSSAGLHIQCAESGQSDHRIERCTLAEGVAALVAMAAAAAVRVARAVAVAMMETRVALP